MRRGPYLALLVAQRLGLELGLQHGERRARAAVRADERGVPGVLHRGALPVVEVDARHARAQSGERVEDEARDLRGVVLALLELDRRLVAPGDQAARLGEPDLALGRLQH